MREYWVSCHFSAGVNVLKSRVVAITRMLYAPLVFELFTAVARVSSVYSREDQNTT